jgi:ABC-type nitrate/sulfonate/bicarbonate transport system ATPase subunit
MALNWGPTHPTPGADPSNLWGNARGGSAVSIQVKSRERHPREASGAGDGAGVVLNRVSRAYNDRRGARVEALEGVSLRAARGEVLAVVGPSGCGKTTLLELICGLQRPDAGAIACAPAVLMPQRDLLLPWLSAIDNAALALRIAGDSRREARARAATLFAELGLGGFERARPHELSGGMRQRVAFLRTLLSGKPVLCLDEPFGALDAITREEMRNWLAGALVREPRTVVLVTHDVEEAIVLADRVAVLSPRPGRVVAELAVELPRPRNPTGGEVIALRQRALHALREGAGRTTGREDALGKLGDRTNAQNDHDRRDIAGARNDGDRWP